MVQVAMKTISMGETLDLEFRQSMFWAPDQLDQISAWFEHGPFAFWIVDILKPKQIVELGTHKGYSYFCFCQAIQKLKLETKCMAVDTWKGDEHSFFYGEEVYDAVVEKNKKYKKYSTLIRSTFDDALEKIPPKSIDLLHIDGRHFYEDVQHDYESWLPKLTDSAIVLLHDTNVRERDFGVWKLFKELEKKHSSFEFLHGHGLGVIAPAKVPVAMKHFFSCEVDATRDVFASLGTAISLRWSLQEAQNQIQHANSVGGQMDKLLEENKILTEARASRETELLSAVSFLERQNSVLLHEQKNFQAELRNTIPSKDYEQLKSEMITREDIANSQKPIYRALAKLQADGYRRRTILAKLTSHLSAFIRPEKAKIATLHSSLYFDSEWYLSTYKDVADSGMDPATHYLQYGAREGRDPGPFFSTRSYQSKYPQTAGDGQNPVLHSLAPSWWPARKPRPEKPEEYLSNADRAAIQKHIAQLSHQPLISVVMPAYNTPEKFLRQAIASVQAQLYANWELCIANDASPDITVAKVLDECAAKDKRIKIIHRKENGNISAATNSALELATGEFIALMDHDDLLHETALYEVAAEINAHPDVDVIYSDEDKADTAGRKFDPYHKSDFDPELMLGQNMVSHLGVYRNSLVKKVGGLRIGFEGSQDYDLLLRIWAASERKIIRHIPVVLYHWRQGAEVKSFSEAQLEKCKLAAKNAVNEYLLSTRQSATAIANPVASNYLKVERKIEGKYPLVSIIVPTKDMASLLSICADGILNGTEYPNLELIIVDHQSVEASTHDLFETLKKDSRVSIVPFEGQFNYSKMNNYAVRFAKGSIIALLNNDIEITTPNWLMEMVSHVLRVEIGVVGAKLLYPDGRIQHAGVIMGKGGVAGHTYQFRNGKDLGYFGQAALTRSVSAVTGACLVVRKAVFDEVGGLNAEYLPVAFNDIDFCLKVQSKGYRNVWTPFAELLHHESVSRGAENTPEKQARFKQECDYMRQNWGDIIANDPFYNPNFSTGLSDYEVAFSSRRKKPWAHLLD
jgi:O-antigen biosynthesis protein